MVCPHMENDVCHECEDLLDDEVYYHKRIATLESRIAELEKDKARLDWLDTRDPEVFGWSPGSEKWLVVGDQSQWVSDDLRDAIDGVMEEPECSK